MAVRTYSVNALAIEFQIDRAVATKVARSIEPSAETIKGRPEFTIAAFASGLKAHRAANASNNDTALGIDGAGGGDTSALMAARIRITNASAEAKERENELASGLYILKTESAKAYGALMSIAREIMLGIPGQCADAVSTHTVEDRYACEQIIKLKVYDALTALSTPETYNAILPDAVRRELGME